MVSLPAQVWRARRGGPVMTDQVPSGAHNVVPLRGVMLGGANDVSEALAKAGGGISGKARALLDLVRRHAYGDAGYAPGPGDPEPGTATRFDLPSWSTFLGWDKSELLRLRNRLITERVLDWEPDHNHPGQGVLTFHRPFSDWVPLDQARTRRLHSRPGAGRPRRPETAADSHRHLDIPELIPVSMAAGLSPLPEAVSPDGSSAGATQADIDTGINSGANGHRHLDIPDTSSHRHSDNENLIPVSMVNLPQGQAGAGAAGVLKKEEDKRVSKDTPPVPAARSTGGPGGKEKKPSQPPDPQERTWRKALFAGLREMTGQNWANNPQENGGARTLYRFQSLHLPTGTPPTVEQVLDCYRFTMLKPWYHTQTISLVTLAKKHLGPYLSSPTAYRASVQDEVATRARMAKLATQAPRHVSSYVGPAPAAPSRRMSDPWEDQG